MRWTSLTGLALLVCLSSVALAQRPDQQGNRSRTLSSRQSDALLSTLPDIRTFRARGSDRFLVNLDTVRTGHPYKGKNARRPHTGGHVYFHVPKKAIPDGQVERFPAIYAVADGVISRIDYSFRLREISISSLDRRVSNTRYGIGLMFAFVIAQALYLSRHVKDEGDAAPKDLQP